MAFSRQGYWSGLPCPPLGDLPDPGIEPVSLMSPALAGEFFTTSATWEVPAARSKSPKTCCRTCLAKASLPWMLDTVTGAKSTQHLIQDSASSPTDTTAPGTQTTSRESSPSPLLHVTSSYPESRGRYVWSAKPRLYTRWYLLPANGG